MTAADDEITRPRLRNASPITWARALGVPSRKPSILSQSLAKAFSASATAPHTMSARAKSSSSPPTLGAMRSKSQ